MIANVASCCLFCGVQLIVSHFKLHREEKEGADSCVCFQMWCPVFFGRILEEGSAL